MYDKLVTKVNNIDTSRSSLKNKYQTDKSNLQNKISDADTSGSLKKADNNVKISKIESKIFSIST